ncbi:hypothetical protein ACFV8E_40280 [Streptomyces sp. NPDC059849]
MTTTAENAGVRKTATGDPIVLVWEGLNTHVSHAMRELVSQSE